MLTRCEDGQATVEHVLVLLFVIALMAFLSLGAGQVLGGALAAAFETVVDAF